MTVLANVNPAVLASLVGVPYVARGRSSSGADCWGIVLLGALALWGLKYPDYFYTEHELLHDACDLIDVETREGARWHAAHTPWPGAAVHIFRVNGHKTHCGLHLDGQLFLHSLP